MGDEAVDGSKLGTKLIMFVAIISLALVAFLVGKSLINTGVDNMETAVKNISDSRFSDYDSKVVRGRAVKSSIDTFGNSEYAIVVCTTEMAASSQNTISLKTGLSLANDATRLDDKTGQIASGKIVKINNANMQYIDSNKQTQPVKNAYGVNYNAILQDDEAANEAQIKIDDGYVLYDQDFLLDSNGNVVYYLKTTNMGKKGQMEYIADSSSFQANLIKNTSGDIMGIVFTQRLLQ